METEALELERLLANVTYTYSDDGISKTSKSSVSNKKTKSVSYADNRSNASSNSNDLSNAVVNNKNTEPEKQNIPVMKK